MGHKPSLRQKQLDAEEYFNMFSFSKCSVSDGGYHPPPPCACAACVAGHLIMSIFDISCLP